MSEDFVSLSYHDDISSLSSTQLKTYAESPAEYNGIFRTHEIDPRKSTKQSELGSIMHRVTLEKLPFNDVCMEYPLSCLKSDHKSLNPVPAGKFRDDIFPLIAIKEDGYKTAVKLYDRVMKSALGEILNLDVLFEQRIDAELDGVACRCKPDIHGFVNGVGVAYDLKFTEVIHPDMWFGNAKRFGYHIQNVHYLRCLEKKYGVPFQFRFWCVETVGLHRIEPRQYSAQSIETTREWHTRQLERFARSLELDQWEDNWEREIQIGPWDLNNSDDNELVAWEASDE